MQVGVVNKKAIRFKQDTLIEHSQNLQQVLSKGDIFPHIGP